jgi:hypothetical protein
VRAEGKVEAAPGSDPMALYRERLGVTSVDLSEATVLGMYARADFEAALLLARRVPEARRVGVLVQIVQYSGM